MLLQCLLSLARTELFSPFVDKDDKDKKKKKKDKDKSAAADSGECLY